jgi:EpsI family protein
MLLLFWAGSFWQEDRAAAVDAPGPPGTPRVPAGAATRAPERARARLAAAFAVCAAAAVAPVVALAVLHTGDLRGPIDARAPVLHGWQPVATPLVAWTPQFTPPRAAIAATYARGAQRAGLYVAVYYDQDDASKLVSSANQLIRTTDRTGYLVSSQRRTLEADGRSLEVEDAVLRVKGERVAARMWYWIDGHVTASPVRAKLWQMRARLLGRGDAGMIVGVYAPMAEGERGMPPAVVALARDAASALPGIIAHRLRGSDAS